MWLTRFRGSEMTSYRYRLGRKAHRRGGGCGARRTDVARHRLAEIRVMIRCRLRVPLSRILMVLPAGSAELKLRTASQSQPLSPYDRCAQALWCRG